MVTDKIPNSIRSLAPRQKGDQERLEEVLIKILELGDLLDHLSVRDRTEPLRLLSVVIERARYAPHKREEQTASLTEAERELLGRIARECD